ncbi:MAG: VCBS repeat-containing protein, partial [Myxococcales bacterium]|nr:VCBS repeat-containing protein [Myxococcales bacterium]
PRGPFVIAARVAPGDGALAVRLLYALDGQDPLDRDCVDGPPVVPWRVAVGDGGADGADAGEGGADAGEGGADAGGDADAGAGGDAGVGAPEPPCHRLALAGDGELWRGELLGPPFPLGARVLYRLVAVDDDGDRAVWPADAPAIFDVGWDAPLAVTAIAPIAGPAAGGTEVLLRGEGFGPGLAIRFGGRAAAVAVESAHLARARTPSGVPGAVDVVVTRAAQRVALAGAYTYDPPPTLTRVDPDEAPADAEALLIVEGGGFVAGAVVELTAAPAPSVTAAAEDLGPSRLAATAPPLAAGTYDVTVQNPDGQRSTLRGALVLRPPPRLDAIDPERGADVGGAVVRLRGADLRAPGAVWFGARPAPRVVVDPDGQGAEVVAPRHVEGLVDVVFYNPDGQSAALVEVFRFVGPPLVEAVDPEVAGRCGGGLATLRGRNLEAGMRVLVGGRAAEVVEVSPDGTTAVIRMPPGAVGAARVEVVAPDGRVFRADGLVAYDRRPVVRAVEPARVPVWGQDDVVIAGADLDAVTGVTVDGAAATDLRRVVGDDPCDGRLIVDLPAGEDGPADVQLDDARGEAATLPAGVQYVAPVLEPSSGLVPGYTNATLRGVGLVAGLTMTIGGRAPRAARRISDTEWQVLTPAGEPGPAALRFALAAQGRSATVRQGFVYRVFRDRTMGRLTAPGDCNDVSVGDLDGDGDLDVLGAFGGMGGLRPIEQPPAVFFNDGAADFRRVELRPTGNGINGRLGDADGDGDLDLLFANLSGPENRLFLNDGGSFREDVDFPARDPSYDADFVDVDGDGDLDVFSLRIGSPANVAVDGPEQLWLNDGRGGFVDARDRLPHDLRDVHDHDFAHGDLDGDGLPDIVIVVDNLSEGFGTARNRLWMNQGGGRFAWRPSPFDTVQGDWLDVKLVDVDGDGDLDVLMPQDYLEGFSFPGTPPLAVWINDGAANFVAAHDRVNGLPRLPAYEVVPVDLDADGDLDLIVAVFGITYTDGTVDPFRSVLLLNDGAAWFEASAAFAEGLAEIASTNFAAADFDGDGDVDLIECAARGRSMLWLQE